MAARISWDLPFTRKQLYDHAYREARRSKLDAETSRGVAENTLQRVILGNETIYLVVADEIKKAQKAS